MQRSDLLQKLTLLVWIATATAFLAIVDYATGYELNFFLFYFIGPITVAAFELGFWAAVIGSALCTFTWATADIFAGHDYSTTTVAFLNMVVRLAAFVSLSWVVSRIRTLLDEERTLSEELRATLAEVKRLEALLPICAECKKIRDERGGWQQMEVYIGKRTGSQFSHGLCPDCARAKLARVGLSYEEADKQ